MGLMLTVAEIRLALRSFMKIGVMVFLCHDVNDIFLEGTKAARYAKNELLTNGLMGVFVLTWFSSRMYYFPAYVIRSVWNEPLEVRRYGWLLIDYG